MFGSCTNGDDAKTREAIYGTKHPPHWPCCAAMKTSIFRGHESQGIWHVRRRGRPRGCHEVWRPTVRQSSRRVVQNWKSTPWLSCTSCLTLPGWTESFRPYRRKAHPRTTGLHMARRSTEHFHASPLRQSIAVMPEKGA